MIDLHELIEILGKPSDLLLFSTNIRPSRSFSYDSPPDESGKCFPTLWETILDFCETPSTLVVILTTYIQTVLKLQQVLIELTVGIEIAD